MSNKKQPYIIKTSAVDAAASVPPRYQPPPQPPGNPGILKHSQQHPQQHQQQPSQSALPAKDVKQVYSAAAKNSQDPSAAVKPPYPPDPSKYYPAAGPPQGYRQQYLGYPYPAQPRPTQEATRLPQQQQRPTRPYEEEPQRSQQSQEAIRTNHPRPPPPQEEPTTNGVHPPHSTEPRLPSQHRPVQRYPLEEDFHRVAQADMLKFVRKTDGETSRMPAVHGDASRHVQGMMGELRVLKEANQRLADDNQELRDLCCFLDDDRQKGRKLAREWQRFGRYTASVMRQEVSAYQSKLRELDNKQQELIKDNLELKELCLYLDEERAGGSVCPSCGSGTTGALRDDGDGSSSSTNADEPGLPTQFTAGINNPPRRSASRERLLHDNLARQRNTFNDQTMQYLRSLEQRVKHLEDEKRSLQHKINQLAPESSAASTDPEPPLTGRPEAVVRALQVLEVREQLEGRAVEREVREEPVEVVTADMDDGEKALVREMCNVVWRKLEEGPQPRR